MSLTNGGTRVRAYGLLARAATVLLAASIGMLANGLPGWAQGTAPSSGQDDGYYATPPPVDRSKLPADNGAPDQKYKLSKQCVQKAQVVGTPIVLKNRAWGQDYLQLQKTQDLVKAATGHRGKYADGRPVKVAVIDTGVTPHPYFQDRLEGGGEYVFNSPAGPGKEDCDGHGTEVAGIIAGNPDDPDVGFIGVAPDATIVSIRQSSQNYTKDTTSSSAPSSSQQSSGGSPSSPPSGGGGAPGAPNPSTSDTTAPGQNNQGRQQNQGDTAGTLGTLAQAVVRAANTDGVKVINMSVDNCRPSDGTITPPEQQLQAAVDYAVNTKDVVVVAAAANITDTCPQNNQPNPNMPRSIVSPPWFAGDVLSVAAIEKDGSIATFSVSGPWVSLAAPGTEITSLDPAVGANDLANLTFEGPQAGAIQGTSFAAPYVAGVAALVRAKYPNLNAHQVMTRLETTAQHPAAPNGHDNFVGYGVVNPVAAVSADVPSEEGIPPAAAIHFPSDVPQAGNRNWTPMIVALAGTGGGLVALLITLFVVHTIRRNRPDPALPQKPR